MHRVVWRAALLLPSIRIGLARTISNGVPIRKVPVDKQALMAKSKDLADRLALSHKEAANPSHIKLEEETFAMLKEIRNHKRTAKSVDYWLRQYVDLVRKLNDSNTGSNARRIENIKEVWKVNHDTLKSGWVYDPPHRTVSYYLAMTSTAHMDILVKQSTENFLEYLKFAATQHKNKVEGFVLSDQKFICSTILKIGNFFRTPHKKNMLDLNSGTILTTSHEFKESFKQKLTAYLPEIKPMLTDMMTQRDILNEKSANLLMQGLTFLTVADHAV